MVKNKGSQGALPMLEGSAKEYLGYCGQVTIVPSTSILASVKWGQ